MQYNIWKIGIRMFKLYNIYQDLVPDCLGSTTGPTFMFCLVSNNLVINYFNEQNPCCIAPDLM